ncbi:MAG: peptidase C39 family protein [Parahaliea sp.]
MKIRRARNQDLPALLALEAESFRNDCISRRSFRRWLRHDDCLFLVAIEDDLMLGYALITRRRGTQLCRLYSLAVAHRARGQGVARALLQQGENDARALAAIYIRLEVATDNYAAIRLYRAMGYTAFGLYRDYYDDHGDAIRMQKCIHAYQPVADARTLPWLAQTTAFTCGPAALMMAMAGLPGDYQPSEEDEIQLWREATTIFMTSGHGGCHPLGLALAARRRGFISEAWINIEGPLFLDGVRDENKKRIMRIAHEQFVKQCVQENISIHYSAIDQQQIIARFQAGANILILISSYRMDSLKAPHWVVMSGVDEHCLYVHDPDLEDSPAPRRPLDCQHLPIAHASFAAMSRFGSKRLRAVVIIENTKSARKGTVSE